MADIEVERMRYKLRLMKELRAEVRSNLILAMEEEKMSDGKARDRDAEMQRAMLVKWNRWFEKELNIILEGL